MSFRKLLLTAAILGLPAMSYAASPSPKVRGTVTSISGDTVEIKTDDGKTESVKIDDKTRFIAVTKSSLDKINKDSYIGTATKDVGNKLIAVEVVIFPEAMRGAGDGHYDWDPLPDHTLGGNNRVSTTMTNGNVSVATAAGGKVNTTMTNGNVATSEAAGGAKQLTVTYKGGEQHILVPPNVPVVDLAPGQRDQMKQGSHVVATTAKDSNLAAGIAVGLDGVTPPM